MDLEVGGHSPRPLLAARAREGGGRRGDDLHPRRREGCRQPPRHWARRDDESRGIKKWRAEYSKYLRGADIVVLPDNHAEGRKHGEQVVASLDGIAKRIRILDIGKHWD